MKKPTMPRTLLLLVVAAAPLGACVEKLAAPARTLASFDVKLDLAGAPVPASTASTCSYTAPNGTESTDLCPGLPGDADVFVPYPGDRFAQVRIDIRAIGSDRTKADDDTVFPLNGRVSIGLRAGEVFGPMTQVDLVDGKADDVPVRLRRTPGPTYIWVEDDLPRNDGKAPSYAIGWSDTPIVFGQPRIADIQKDDEECCSPLFGQRVEVTDGLLYVTRITGNGFNVQDVNAPEWGGLFVFAFNGIEGLRTGTRLLSLGGGITEFQGGTQMTEPIFTPVNGLCARITAGAAEGGQDTSDDEQGVARVRCPRGSECVRDDEGIDRCTPDSDPSLDSLGRKVCIPGEAAGCPSGLACRELGDEGAFCQVTPLPMVGLAFPDYSEGAYCGPINTGRDLSVEALEGSLVSLSGTGPLGVRLGGLPVCKKPDGDDPLRAVRSSCNLVDADGKAVDEEDCTLAVAGDDILRDAQGSPCFRGNQACKDEGIPFGDLQSTCNPDESKDRCITALPGEAVAKDDKGNICRATLDDFITSGFFDFGQAKALYEDEEGTQRCATLNFDGLTSFNTIDVMERGDLWKSVTGTLRQVRFRPNESGNSSSFWVVDVRFLQDLEPLD